MSKQLAISAAFSIFTMAAFALFATPDANSSIAVMQTGAATNVTAPALDQLSPVLSSLVR